MNMAVAIRLIIFVVLVLTVVVLGSVLGLLWSMPDIHDKARNDQICLPSSDESLLRCGQMSIEFHDYLKTSIQQQHKRLTEEENKQNAENKQNNNIGLKQHFVNNYWDMKPAARFTGAIQPEPRTSDNGRELVPIREWRHGKQLWDNGGFRRYGVKFVNGRIVVPVAGTYQVYSFLDMYEPCIYGTGTPDVENRNQSIKHSIFKFSISEKYETELISGVQPHLKSGNLYFNIYSSFISSIVQLNAGDELVVKVSNITYLKYPEVNYFGVNLI